MVSDDDVLVATRPRGLRHLQDAPLAIAPGGVHVQVPEQVVHLDQFRQQPLACSLELPLILA